jgi:chromosome segregation ATPase
LFGWKLTSGQSLAADQEKVKEAEDNIEQCNTEIVAVHQKLNDFDVNVQEAKDNLVQIQNQAKDLQAEVAEATATAEKAQDGLTELQVLLPPASLERCLTTLGQQRGPGSQYRRGRTNYQGE